jgi:hypothetical protein
MTTYADRFDLREPSLFKLANLADALDGLLVTYAQFQNYLSGGSVISTTSTSLTPMSSSIASLSVTVAPGEVVLLSGECAFSHGTQYAEVQVFFTRDNSPTNLGNPYNPMSGKAYRANTGGVDFCVALLAIDNPGAGTHTYGFAWNVFTGTGYSARQQLTATVIQNS